jgi:hypothetical protein
MVTLWSNSSLFVTSPSSSSSWYNRCPHIHRTSSSNKQTKSSALSMNFSEKANNSSWKINDIKA